MYKLSIIIPVYNAKKVIKERINSILDSIEESFEVIFVDDGSSDGSAELIGELVRDCTNICLYPLENNYGSGYARNIGIKYAKGEFIYFFDIDDEFIGFDVLGKMYKIAKKSDCVICGGSFAIVREDKKIYTGHQLDKEYTFYNDGFVDYKNYQYDYGFMRFLYQSRFLKENKIQFHLFKRYQDPPFMLEAFSKAGCFYAMKDITYIMNAHEKKEWSQKEIKGLCDGIMNNLQKAVSMQLEHCYRNNIKRIFSDFGKVWIKYNMENNVFLSKVKKEVELQDILFPRASITQDVQLFYRTTGDVFKNEEDFLLFGQGVTADFNTYFNAFSCKKWKRYTGIQSISIILRYCGEIEVTLCHNEILYGKEHEEVIEVKRFYSLEAAYVCVDFGELSDTGNFSFKITALSEGACLYGGFYASNTFCESRDVKCALIFCTFNRERYIKKNIQEISMLDEKIKIYVVDNAHSLQPTEFQDVCVLIPNKNIGGAGGFSRGMIQVLEEQKNERFTHFILMDDDVVLDSRVLVRLKFFLSKITTEYQQNFVGGAMLRKDLKYYQVESGATWNYGKIHSNGHGLDMRLSYNCLLNDLDYRNDYSAWWFCVVPIEYLNSGNLPLPLFVFHDDVDYGLRNKAKIITLNGICTWHDPFESKLSAMRVYYENRNRLIVNCVHEMEPSCKQLLKQVKQEVMREIFLYRYQNAKMILRGINDFLNGSKWLCTLDAEEYNKDICTDNIKMECIENLGISFDYDWYRLCCTIKDCDWIHKVVRIGTFNGLLLKANREIILPLYANRPVQGYRALKILYYDEITNKGYIAIKKWDEIRTCISLYKKTKRKIKKYYKNAVQEYKENYKYLTSLEMWEKYLDKS